MRELLLIPIVVSLCVVALFRPRFGMYCYLWFALMRPDVLAWSKGLFPYSMALAVSTFIGFLPQAGSIKRIFSNPITVGLLLMQIPIILSVYNALIFADAWDSYALCLRIMGTSLLIPMLIRSVDQFKTLILSMKMSKFRTHYSVVSFGS